VNTYVATSCDGGRSWGEWRLSRRPSQPNYETHVDARVPWYGDYIYLSALLGLGTFAAWVDTRDVVPADDTRPDSEENGLDVFAPCAWNPNMVFALPTGYAAPPASDPCVDQGGLDVNIYGAWVSRSRSRPCPPWRCGPRFHPRGRGARGATPSPSHHRAPQTR
jgi:hypothetical protein